MPNYADQAFVEDTLKNNDAQVQMSQLAQQKASSGDVKEFSQRMIEIHTELNQQLAPLAKQLDVSQNQKPSKEQKKEIAQLEQLSGPDFDTRLSAGHGQGTGAQPEAVQERRIRDQSQHPEGRQGR